MSSFSTRKNETSNRTDSGRDWHEGESHGDGTEDNQDA